MIRHNLGYKLLALAVALVLWTYVNSERNPQARKTITVSVEAVNVAKGYIAELATNEVAIGIEGLKTVVDNVRTQDVRAYVNLRGIKPTRGVTDRKLKLRTRIAGVAEGDLDISTSPSVVKAKVEALGGKRLPVEMKFLAAPPLGYSYGAPVISPASASVSGKLTEVARVRRLVLALPERPGNAPVDDYFEVTPLDAAGNPVSGVSLEPDKVRLKLDLVEVPATKTVIVSPSITGEPRYPYRVTRVSATPSSVTLEGKPNVLVGISTVTTERVSIEGATSTVTDDVALRVPPEVRAVDRARTRVTVYVGTAE